MIKLLSGIPTAWWLRAGSVLALCFAVWMFGNLRYQQGVSHQVAEQAQAQAVTAKASRDTVKQQADTVIEAQKQHEDRQQKAQVIYRTISNDVVRYIETNKEVETDQCLDAEALAILNRAIDTANGETK